MLNRPPRADSDGKDDEIFGMHPGDLGVILIAALFTAGFVLMLFSRWQTPHLSALFTPPPPPKAAPAKPVPKGETEIFILPAPAPKPAH